MTDFKTNGLPLLIGSLPITSHEKATRLILDSTPEIPLWPQLPAYREEGMISQFVSGMPGLAGSLETRQFIDTSSPEFDRDYLAFYEEYLSVTDDNDRLDTSRFTLTPETGRGFREFLKQIDLNPGACRALKGQVSGPITFATGVRDQNDRAIFYNDQLRDAAIKHLALHGQWQARQFSRRGLKPIVFFDEPALAGFGTSAFITISREDVAEAIREVIQGVHLEDGLAGVHVCANTEWDLLLDSDIDIISFDAFSFFDRFILYPRGIKAFLNRGGILAWGIVPTSDAATIAGESTGSLCRNLESQFRQVEALGFGRQQILEQALITPSCGTGSLDLDSALTVLRLTGEVSRGIRGIA
ncbi:MAG: hypothetical protein V1793_08295 [Pseudomonadota bacterium]